VTAKRGAFVLRVQAGEANAASFQQHVRIWGRAAEAGIAPRIVHVDEARQAIVCERVAGVPFAAVAGDPVKREAALESLLDRLRALHGLDTADILESNPLSAARAVWDTNRVRPGFPAWAMSVGSELERLATTLAGDRRRVLSHNDVNPANVVWDGARAWLVDWEVAGLAHPYYDLATLALFTRMDDWVAFRFVELHDRAALDERAREVFQALRKLVAIFCGLTLLRRLDDLRVRPAPELGDAPTLMQVYTAMRTGELEIASPFGRASMGLALLAEGCKR
jgi:aminoglycoside phosphotransferase (APT) family kinase protein